jgi:hypothetical protein
MKGIVHLSCFLAVASGCMAEAEQDIDEGAVVLENPDDEGKADSVFGKSLHYVVRGDWSWLGEDEMMTDSEVLTQNDTTVRVRALRTIFDVPANGDLLQISVDAESFNDLGEISTDMAFLLMVPMDGVWQPVRCEHNYFEKVLVDPINQEIDAIARTDGGDVARTYSFESCGIPDDIGQVAILPFPSSNWGNLEGYYHLKIEAECGGFACPRSSPRH